jgi:hypothetical protein
MNSKKLSKAEAALLCSSLLSIVIVIGYQFI